MDKHETQTLYFDGNLYFDALIENLRHAKRSIDFETYIFELGAVGNRVLDALEAASRRGVKVRLLVDGFGSWKSIRKLTQRLLSTPVQLRVYRPILLDGSLLARKTFVSLARRNHRKTCVVDGKSAWIGSFNISDVHRSWRDTGLCIRNEGFPELIEAFERAWDGPEEKTRTKYLFSSKKRHFLLNCTPALRRAKNREIARRVGFAKERVWITTPYFSPDHTMLAALRDASSRGADVRLLLPKSSDVPGMSWINSVFYKRLLRGGIQIYLYQPFLLHAKTVLADQWAIVGSSNLNHRSWIHDLEADAIVTDPEALEKLRAQFQHDLEASKKLTVQDANCDTFLNRTLDHFGMRLRYWT